jgi:hypothetical protein
VPLYSGHVKWESILEGEAGRGLELVAPDHLTLIAGFARPAFTGFLIDLGTHGTYWQAALDDPQQASGGGGGGVSKGTDHDSVLSILGLMCCMLITLGTRAPELGMRHGFDGVGVDWQALALGRDGRGGMGLAGAKQVTVKACITSERCPLRPPGPSLDSL